MEQYRIDPTEGMEFGLYTLGDHILNPLDGKRLSAQERIKQIIEMAKLAEQAGLDVFSVGESHQKYFVSQAHTVILSAIDRKSTRLNSSHVASSYAVFCLKKKTVRTRCPATRRMSSSP